MRLGSHRKADILAKILVCGLFFLSAILYVEPNLQSQTKDATDPCHARPAGERAKSFLAFDEFNKELREAITRQDAVELAFLVTFPLRVNEAGGTILLNDVGALKTHFQDVFTPAMRKEILSSDSGESDCGAEGIGYGRGVIWVHGTDRGYSIWSVNRDATGPYKEMYRRLPRIEFVCQTQTHRIVVDMMAGEVLRYRSWDKPRPVSGTPNIELLKGKDTFEGTNVCAVPIYTFQKGETTYSVEGGLGCFAESDNVPKDATGHLAVTVGERTLTEQWCY